MDLSGYEIDGFKLKRMYEQEKDYLISKGGIYKLINGVVATASFMLPDGLLRERTKSDIMDLLKKKYLDFSIIEIKDHYDICNDITVSSVVFLKNSKVMGILVSPQIVKDKLALEHYLKIKCCE